MIVKYEATRLTSFSQKRMKICYNTVVHDEPHKWKKTACHISWAALVFVILQKLLIKLRATVNYILKKVLRNYSYKLVFVQQLLPRDLCTRQTFVLQFLTWCRLEIEGLWNIMRANEAHIHSNGTVNILSCRIRMAETRASFTETVWRGFEATFILDPYFLEEYSTADLVMWSVIGQ